MGVCEIALPETTRNPFYEKFSHVRKFRWVDWRPIQKLTDESLKMTMIGLAHPEGQERLKEIL